MEGLDKTCPVRQGEELNLEKLATYLGKYLDGFNSTIKITQFPSGYSNLTYLLSTNSGEFVLRRPPIGAHIKTAHDMIREYTVLSKLKHHYHKIPKPLLLCENENIIGAPFYIMERVKGIILRNKLPDSSFNAEVMRKISYATVKNLSDIHAIDIKDTGLDELGKPEGYVERQVEGWIKRYYNAQTDEVKAMNNVAEWMQINLPRTTGSSIIHNDYKYDNLVWDVGNFTNILAVLDWEMATVGDPLMDLGTTLAYWNEAGDHPLFRPFNLTWCDGNLSRNQVVNLYRKESGRDTSQILFYYVFGCFKIAVIVQQIYSRYKKGLTKDPRFANLIDVVLASAEKGIIAVESGKISDFD